MTPTRMFNASDPEVPKSSNPQTSTPEVLLLLEILASAERPRPAAALEHQPDLADHHRLVDRLDHVVDRQARDGNGGERFHLDAGLRRSAHARLDVVAAGRGR